MILKFIPLSVYAKRKSEYGIYILGFYIKNREQAIGFKFHHWKYPERREWILILSFYGFIKRMIIKTIPYQKILKCKDCGGYVWENNLYCQTCQEHKYEDDVEIINL